MSLAAIDEAMHAIEAEIRQVHGIRSMLTTAGGGFLGGVNQGNVFLRIAPSEERKFSISRFLRGLAHLDPGAAFRDN
jgi:HAE1 family hydrophobic/amphiphilic exporter-1